MPLLHALQAAVLQVKLKWLDLMEHYFNVRESLVGLVLIVDSRRGLGAQDAVMLEWILARDRLAHVLLTKADKLNRRDSQRVLKETLEACSDTSVTAQLFSAHAKQGVDEAREVMQRWLTEGEKLVQPVDSGASQIL